MSNDHHGHAGHNHTHGMVKQSLRIAFFLTIIVLAAELIGGLLANSLALLSDAGHVVTDLFALGLAWFASLQAEKLPDERKTFGYHRVGILAALVNVVSLIVIALVITWQAIGRFQHPEAVQPFIIFISAAIGIAVNLFIGFGLQRESHNLNVRAAALHVFGDVAISCGVIIAGLLILLTGWTLLDPLLSIAISVFIALAAWRILRETTDILLEATPKDISMSQLVKDMLTVHGVQDVHDLHVWSITSGMSALSCHVLIDNVPPSDSAPILRSLTEVLREKYHVAHATIQFECDAHKAACCEWDGLYCRMETKARCCSHSQQEQHTGG